MIVFQENASRVLEAGQEGGEVVIAGGGDNAPAEGSVLMPWDPASQHHGLFVGALSFVAVRVLQLGAAIILGRPLRWLAKKYRAGRATRDRKSECQN